MKNKLVISVSKVQCVNDRLIYVNNANPVAVANVHADIGP